MQQSGTLRILQAIVRRPTVGMLTDLRDENYFQLLRLAPDLAELRGACRSRRAGHPDLHLSIIEQSPYTTLARLTYQFGNGADGAEPNALLRAYHDARQVDVLEMRHGMATRSLYQAPALHNAWRTDLFLSKWLRYCRDQGHKFLAGAGRAAAKVPALAD